MIMDREFQMKNAYLTLGCKSFMRFAIILFLFASPLAGAYAACCAGHGGVASCNKTTGKQMCKDGTVSPTCTCAIPKKAKKTTVKTGTVPATSTTKSTTTTTTKPKSSWWGGKSTTTTTTTTTNSTKGCCSRHGGIAQCDKASGHQMCKDGTKSPTCTCQ